MQNVSTAYSNVPVPNSTAGRQAIKALLNQRNILSALEALHAEMGDVFRIPLPGFDPVFLVGPQANRFVTVTGRQDFRWRPEGDPVTRLLRDGLLVTDGDFHDRLRQSMNPAMHKHRLDGYLQTMVSRTDQVLSTWEPPTRIDMLVEMRKIALLILMDSLFQVDFSPQLKQLWPAILRTLKYISPGIWVIWGNAPRPGYWRARLALDRYLYQIIADRRATPSGDQDLLGALVHTSGMSDDLIRDQLLTMLIAGHDTSTALLAWMLYLLNQNPEVYRRVRQEIDLVVGQAHPDLEKVNQLDYLDRVLKETLRLYPPIHIGNRKAAVDLEFQGYRIPAGTRVVYSIYLTHRMPQYWPDPQRFDPDRFQPDCVGQRPHYTYLPFGGGPRNCIGMAFAQVEAKVVLVRLLQRFELKPLKVTVHPHMGATLEPRPGVFIELYQRKRHP